MQSHLLFVFVLVERVLGVAVVECVLLFVVVDVVLVEDEDLVDDEDLVVEEGVECEVDDADLVEEEVVVVVVVGAWYLLGLPAVVVLGE